MREIERRTWEKGPLLVEEPSTFVEPMSFVDAPLWKEVINSDFESIIQNRT